jgi:hypothetical protein
MFCASTSGSYVRPALLFPVQATRRKPSATIWPKWRQAVERRCAWAAKTGSTELFENTPLGVVGPDGWAKIQDDSSDWRGSQLRQALTRFGQVVSQVDPNAGGLTWDQAAKKLATGE